MDIPVAPAPTELLCTARILRRPRSVSGQLVDFFNDEVLVQLAAAAWGLVVPIGMPMLSQHLWFKALNALASLLFFSALQVAVGTCLERYPRRRGFWLKCVSAFLQDALVWQPRLSWAQFAQALSEQIQVSVICATGCPTAAVLALVVVVLLLLRVFTLQHYLGVKFHGSIWQYPLATFSLAILQFSAKIFYSGWLLFSRGFDMDNQWGDRVDECLNVNTLRPTVTPRQQAEQALWSCTLLLFVASTAHRQLPKLIKVVLIEDGGTNEIVRLEKLMWFIAFIWGVGFPDYMLTVMVQWLGADVLQSTQAGYMLMYLFSLCLFVVISGIMQWHFHHGCQRTLYLGEGEDLGADWTESRAEPGVVRLVQVHPGSIAAGRRVARGFAKLVGCRVIEINGQLVQRKLHVENFIDQSEIVEDAESGKPFRKVHFLFASPATAMLSLEDALGGSAPQFLQRTLNNMSWWPFEANVRQLVTSLGGDSSPWWCCVRSGTVALVAIAITVVSVAIFVVNRVAWLRYLEGHIEDVTPVPRTRTMPNLRRFRRFSQKSVFVLSEMDDFISAGPRPPFVPQRRLLVRDVSMGEEAQAPETVLRIRSNVELEKARSLTCA